MKVFIVIALVMVGQAIAKPGGKGSGGKSGGGGNGGGSGGKSCDKDKNDALFTALIGAANALTQPQFEKQDLNKVKVGCLKMVKDGLEAAMPEKGAANVDWAAVVQKVVGALNKARDIMTTADYAAFFAKKPFADIKAKIVKKLQDGKMDCPSPREAGQICEKIKALTGAGSITCPSKPQ